jgi:hypothetical protein
VACAGGAVGFHFATDRAEHSLAQSAGRGVWSRTLKRRLLVRRTESRQTEHQDT